MKKILLLLILSLSANHLLSMRLEDAVSSKKREREVVQDRSSYHALRDERTGNTSLHFAASEGQIEAIRELLSRGASIEALNKQDRTPVHLASERGQTEAIRLLLDCGAQIDARDCLGMHSLHYAAAGGHIAAIRLLLHRGTRLDIQDKCGLTPLHWAAAFSTHKGAISLLLDRGAQLEARDLLGRTPLHSAAERCETNALEVLLDKGSNVKAQDSRDVTPLHLAAAARIIRIEAIGLLLSRGAYIEAQDQDGRTPLHWIAERREKAFLGFDVQGFKFLLQHNASLEARNVENQTPLMLLAKQRFGIRKNPELISFIGKGQAFLVPKNYPLAYLISSQDKIKHILMMTKRKDTLLARLPRNICWYILRQLNSVGDNALIIVLVERLREGRVHTIPFIFRKYLSEYLLNYTKEKLPSLIEEARNVTIDDDIRVVFDPSLILTHDQEIGKIIRERCKIAEV